ncbi:MAG: hypothetical protein U7123_11005 [Potamolinea sp.]
MYQQLNAEVQPFHLSKPIVTCRGDDTGHSTPKILKSRQQSAGKAD